MRTRRVLNLLLTAGLLAATATAANGTTGTTATTGVAAGCAPTWRLVAPPLAPGSKTTISGLAVVSANDTWFPASANAGPTSEEPWVLHWNGRSLGVVTAVPQSPFTRQDAEFGGSFNSATDGWVLGAYVDDPGLNEYLQYAAHWNGSHWTVTPLAVAPDPTLANLYVTSIASLSPSDSWMVGGSYQAGSVIGYPANSIGALIEHWDGTQWSVAGNPSSSQPGTVLSAVTATSASDIWAVGQQNAQGVSIPFAEHSDGSSWTVIPVPAGASPSLLDAVTADSATDAWAVGVQLEPGTSNAGTGLVEHWNGTAWSVVTNVPDLGNSALTAVYAASPVDVWATVENVLAKGDFGMEDFLHWDGSSWTTVPVPGPQEYGLDYWYAGIDGTGPGNVWAAGWAVQTNGTETPLIAHLSCA